MKLKLELQIFQLIPCDWLIFFFCSSTFNSNFFSEFRFSSCYLFQSFFYYFFFWRVGWCFFKFMFLYPSEFQNLIFLQVLITFLLTIHSLIFPSTTTIFLIFQFCWFSMAFPHLMLLVFFWRFLGKIIPLLVFLISFSCFSKGFYLKVRLLFDSISCIPNRFEVLRFLSNANYFCWSVQTENKFFYGLKLLCLLLFRKSLKKDCSIFWSQVKIENALFCLYLYHSVLFWQPYFTLVQNHFLLN